MKTFQSYRWRRALQKLRRCRARGTFCAALPFKTALANAPSGLSDAERRAFMRGYNRYNKVKSKDDPSYYL